MASCPSRVLASCSWPCTPEGGLSRALRVRRLGAAEESSDSDDEEEEEAAALAERPPGAAAAAEEEEAEAACELRLRCEAAGGEAVAAVAVVSAARHMELYAGEEYCGTARGRPRRAARPRGETEKVTLYRKYVKLECPATSCRIKLLSIGEKQRVLISKIIVEVKTVSAKLATDFPSLGSSIDLNRVQTIMESMGSKLSPGAQQLMDMVRFQQKNSLPLGDKLNRIFEKNSHFEDEHPVDGLHGAAVQTSLHLPSTEPLPDTNCASSEAVYEDLKRSLNQNTPIPKRENNSDSARVAAQQNMLDPRNDFKIMRSLLMKEPTSENPNLTNPGDLLPFLQNLCRQVNHLRLKDGNRLYEKSVATKEESIQSVGVEQQPICSYLEKIISKNMDLMEKKLMDYIDRQIQSLQTHIDNKMVLLMDLVQNSKSNKITQTHYDTSEGFSNGER